MAAAPAVHIVNVAEFSDPTEVRPSDDQAIVFEVDRETPLRVYIEELNVFINSPKSFLFAGRISGERACVVMKTADQAKKLVEEICSFKVNNQVTQIKYFMEKAVKVIISNALYNVSNSALKRYLVKKCGIRTASSVSELRMNMGKENADIYDVSSFRRFIFIHPEDTNKLPNGPVKFDTGKKAYNVFFEVETTKCFLCGATGHLRATCPKTEEKERDDVGEKPKIVENNEQRQETRSTQDVGSPSSVDEIIARASTAQTLAAPTPKTSSEPPSYASMLTSPTTDSILIGQLAPKKPLKPSAQFANIVQQTEDKTMQFSSTTKMIVENLKPKRPLSLASSEASIDHQLIDNQGDKTNFKKPKKSSAKKTKTMDEKQLRDEIFSVGAQLEPVRPHLEATQKKHNLNFDTFVELVVKTMATEKKMRKAAVLKYTNDTNAFTNLISEIHSLVKGKSIKQKLTRLQNSIVNFSSECSEDSESDVSQASDLEHTY